MTVDLDHTSFAVRDGLAWARRLRRELGAVPVAGERVGEAFRWVQLWVGTADEGGVLELLEPAADGFLTRFLDARGEGPHHLTFKVSDLRDVVGQVRDLGLTVTGEDYDHPEWLEAFVAPDRTHGTVVQLAQTNLAYPPPSELLATRERAHAAAPSTAHAGEPDWWVPMWDAEPLRQARVGATHLVSTDLDLTRRLFGDVLEGAVEAHDDGLRLTWPSGSVAVSRGERAGVVEVDVVDGPDEPLDIGGVRLSSRPQTT